MKGRLNMRNNGRYELCREQFNEIVKFYHECGFNDKQCKKLSERCFGIDVKVAKDVPYRYNWCFNPVFEHRFSGPVKKAAFGRFFNSVSAPMCRSAMSRSLGCSMDMQAEGCCAVEEPAFNTSETHVVSEHEETGPIDSPQCIFSANVNSASWSYVRDKINRNQRIDKHFVRIEEIINSYSYDLEAPKGDDLFSINIESGKCPWKPDSELLFLGLKGKKADINTRHNLALLVDVSGSMEGNWILVQMSLAAIISKLKKGDTISIISYSDKTVTVAKQIDCGDTDKCVDAICNIIGCDGCTHGSEGLENAYDYLKEHFDKDGNNRVFIFTDGDFNFGITGEGDLQDFIYKKRETGIYLSIVGYGFNNFKDNTMETLAYNGNGNYSAIMCLDDIRESLGAKLFSNLVTVAKDVKISIEFNPKYVSSYRLIGYDWRALTQKEFNDTSKAVDGIGSEHNVIALIELKRGEAEQKYAARYVAPNKIDSDEFAYIEIHYKSPDDNDLVMTRVVTLEDIEGKSADNLKVASALAAFGLLVRDSDYKGDLTGDLLLDMLENAGNMSGHSDVIKRYIKTL